jgi:hypothetical protein
VLLKKECSCVLLPSHTRCWDLVLGCVISRREGCCGYIGISFVMLSRSQQGGRRKPNSQQYFKLVVIISLVLRNMHVTRSLSIVDPIIYLEINREAGKTFCQKTKISGPLNPGQIIPWVAVLFYFCCLDRLVMSVDSKYNRSNPTFHTCRTIAGDWGSFL